MPSRQINIAALKKSHKKQITAKGRKEYKKDFTIKKMS
jgi:hypothetical protein